MKKSRSPAGHEQLVQPLSNDLELRQRQAGKARGIARSTLRYRAVPCDDTGLIEFVSQHIALNPRLSFWAPV